MRVPHTNLYFSVINLIPKNCICLDNLQSPSSWVTFSTLYSVVASQNRSSVICLNNGTLFKVVIKILQSPTRTPLYKEVARYTKKKIPEYSRQIASWIFEFNYDHSSLQPPSFWERIHMPTVVAPKLWKTDKSYYCVQIKRPSKSSFRSSRNCILKQSLYGIFFLLFAIIAFPLQNFPQKKSLTWQRYRKSYFERKQLVRIWKNLLAVKERRRNVARRIKFWKRCMRVWNWCSKKCLRQHLQLKIIEINANTLVLKSSVRFTNAIVFK